MLATIAKNIYSKCTTSLSLSLLHQLQDIDQEIKKQGHSINLNTLSITWSVILTACCCILIYEFARHYPSYLWTIHQIDLFFEGNIKYYLLHHHYANLFFYGWQLAWTLICYFLIPIFVIRYICQQNVFSFHLGYGALSRHLWIYIVFALGLICMVQTVRIPALKPLSHGFIKMYPFYDLASRSWFDLYVWEIGYIVQFFCIEFFFRGFIVAGLSFRFGHLAAVVACMPYMMIHINKLFLEALGSILFGIILGLLALLSRSIWGGVLLHVALALTMDLTSLSIQNRFPQ